MKSSRLILLFLLPFFLSCQTNDGRIKIGVILPLTGNGAIYGEDIKKGIDLAYQMSPLKDKISLIYQDDAADTRQGISALNNLYNKNISICIGGVMSNVAKGLLPIVNAKNILLLSPKATDITLSKKDDYFFRIWPTDDLDGKTSAIYVCDSLKCKRVAILYSNTDYGVGIRDIFKKNLKEGVTVVFDEPCVDNAVDFKQLILKLKQSNPDVVFFPAYYKEILLGYKCMNEVNCNFFYVAGVSSFYEQEIKSAANKMVDKTFFTYPKFSILSQDKLVVDFVNSFTKAYKSSANAFSAYGYDSYKVIEAGIQYLLDSEETVINGQTMKQAISNIKSVDGVTGAIQFDANGDAIRQLQIIWLKDI